MSLFYPIGDGTRLQTNYLDPESFDKFIQVIPKLNNYIYNFRYALNPAKMQLFFKILYYCALRVSEVIQLTKEDINLERRILRVRRAKTGNNQKTSIPQPLMTAFEAELALCPEKLFDISRQTVWSYGKKAGKLADLDIFEDQDKREINGVWTHLFRKSYAKMMYNAGANVVLIDVKLRHSHKSPSMADSTFTYIKPDINALIEWEDKHFNVS